MRFFDYLRQRIELRGFAWLDIAEVSVSVILMYSRYERGHRPLKEGHIHIIASKLYIDRFTSRELWIVYRVLYESYEEEDVTDILNIVA